MKFIVMAEDASDITAGFSSVRLSSTVGLTLRLRRYFGRCGTQSDGCGDTSAGVVLNQTFAALTLRLRRLLHLHSPSVLAADVIEQPRDLPH